MTTSGLVF